MTYPDITLISSICEALHITEHELITASEDLHQNELEKQAQKYQRIKQGYRHIMLALYGLSLLICFICNLAIQHTLSWFFIVLASEAIAFSLTVMPALVSKNHGLWTLGSFIFRSTFYCLSAGFMQAVIGWRSPSVRSRSVLQ